MPVQKMVKVSSQDEEVRVVPVPPYANAAVTAAIPLPEPPIIEIDSAAGHKEPWPNTEDPTYKAELVKAQAARTRVSSEFTILYALPDVKPPDDDQWLELLELYGVVPRKGPQGRKLDYIEFHLLASQSDWDLVWQTIVELTYPKPERIDAQEASFRDNGGRRAVATVEPVGDRRAV